MIRDDFELPEDYQRLEYIQRVVPKIFLLPGFQDEDAAKTRCEEIKSKHPSNYYGIGAFAKRVIDNYVIKLPEDSIQFLTKEEQQRLITPPIDLTPIENTPCVYRHIAKEFVDKFFSTGSLMLTTYKRCKELEDDIRQDAEEGKVELETSEDELTANIGCGFGHNSIMLCCSLSSRYVDSEGNESNNYIEIHDVNAVTNIITEKLINDGIKVQSVIKGPCIYNDRKIARHIDGNNIKRILEQTSTGNTFDFNLIFDMASSIGQNDVYFSKSVEKAVENEYRIVWLLEDEPEKDKYFVDIPEAKQFCRKVHNL